MSSFDKCPTCGEYDFFPAHVCPEIWQAIRSDYDDEEEPREVRGNDAEDAALRLAQNKFSDWEYPEEIEIWVRKFSDDPWQKFDITVQAVPEFTATKKE